MRAANSCPSSFVWQQIVQEGVGELAAEELPAHLEQCTQCQALVTRLLGPGGNWGRVAEQLRRGSLKGVAELEGELKVEAPTESVIPHVRDYVDALEARARQERKKKPYQRRTFPVNRVAGVILIVCGALFFANAFRVTEGLMSSLINNILPAFVLFLLGAVCLVFAGR